MAEEAKQSASRFSIISCRYVVGTVILLLLLAYFSSVVNAVFNPTEINRLVLINCRDDRPFQSLNVSLRGEAEWSEQGSDFGRHAGRNSVVYMNISHAWFGGDLVIKNESNEAIAEISIKPLGRYCGAMIVVIAEDGKAYSGWGRMPDELAIAQRQQ